MKNAANELHFSKQTTKPVMKISLKQTEIL